MNLNSWILLLEKPILWTDRRDQENQRNEHRKEAYKMEKIIDRENKEAVKALKKDNFYFGYMAARKLERADYVEIISGLRKPEAKKVRIAI